MSPLRAFAAIRDARGLKPRAKLLLFLLATHADESVACWPTLEHLGLEAGMSAAAVRYFVHDLRRGCVVELSPGARRGEYVYRLRLEQLEGADDRHAGAPLAVLDAELLEDDHVRELAALGHLQPLRGEVAPDPAALARLRKHLAQREERQSRPTRGRRS